MLSCFSYSERHTAQNLNEEINKILIKWDLQEKIVAVVTDNAANIVSVVRLGSWAHIPCITHTLNCTGWAIVEYFHRSF